MKLNRAVNQVRRAAAFTLAEVVISVGILTISAVGLMGSFRYAFFAMRMARENQRATQIILERAEAIRCFNWDVLISGTNVPPTFTEYYDPTVTNAMGTVYSGTVKIDNVPFSNSYSTNMRQMTITVAWTTAGIQRGRTNITYVSRDGVQNYVY